MVLCFYGRRWKLSYFPIHITPTCDIYRDMSYEEGLFLSKLVLEKLGNRLWLSPLLGVILSAERYLAQGHSLSEKNPQPMSDQKHGLIISLYSVKNPRRNKGCSENGGTNTITINFIRSTLLCVGELTIRQGIAEP